MSFLVRFGNEGIYQEAVSAEEKYAITIHKSKYCAAPLCFKFF